MATAYKVLGQSAPSATTDTTLYTVPSATEAVISTVAVANRGTVSATYRIAIRPDGAALANQHYLAYDASIPANDSVALTLGLTLNAADVLAVYASTANLSFGAFGSEIS
jgi:hypothetical protein